MTKADELRRFDELLVNAEKVLGTRRSRSSSEVHFHGDDAVNYELSHQWGASCLSVLVRLFGKESDYYTRFYELFPSFRDYHPILKAKGIFKAAREDFERGGLVVAPTALTPVQQLRQLFDRFPLIVRRLSQRRTGRPPIAMNDEYDVQYLLDGLLRVLFEDVRPEEWTPSYAGNSSRMDFLLKPERIVIEIKKTRDGLADRQVCDELSIDIQRYRSHQDCRTLVCFVYDPEQRISNPRVLENDLTRKQGELDVIVLVRPL